MEASNMTAVKIPSKQRFIFDNVSWQRYTRLLHVFSDRHLRMTYDRGLLEIMTLTYEHESLSAFIGRLVEVITEELNLQIRAGGSTTFRRKSMKKGLEPDHCFWIAHEADVRSNVRIDLRTDPPPDLALEVDISRSSMNRMGIYAALKVPEVWRYDENGLAFCTLNANGKYDAAAAALCFPIAITAADLLPFLDMRGKIGDNDIIKQFRTWLQAKLAAAP